MDILNDYEREREANIAANRALLAELDLQSGVTAALGLPPPKKPAKKVKPVASGRDSRKKRKREEDEVAGPRRQSARLKSAYVDPNETPAQRKKREAEAEQRRLEEERERQLAEEHAQEAKKPRHQDLGLETLAADSEDSELASLQSALEVVCRQAHPKRFIEVPDDVEDKAEEKRRERETEELQKIFKGLRIRSMAKVNQDRIYSAAYHPEKTKDLIFFGDKHGQLGIWDARAPKDEVMDDDGEIEEENPTEGGKYWRLQPHWPATAKSSISSIKLDPIDAHSLYTTAYDQTVRHFSFVSGISREVYQSEGLVTCIDMPPQKHEMWISDARGGLTHIDLREDTKARRFQLTAKEKIGCVSVNPVHSQYLVTASNDRSLKFWDSRKLVGMLSDEGAVTLLTPPPSSPPRRKAAAEPDIDISDFPILDEFVNSKKGYGILRGQWDHNKSVSSAYWDPSGRKIVSTCYDDTLRVWDVNMAKLTGNKKLPSSRPRVQMHHNCQTGQWLTVFKAQWSANPDVLPHFTVGNMQHSLDIISGEGKILARLHDKRISAVQAVTCSHPEIVARAVSGNASGRCILWAPEES